MNEEKYTMKVKLYPLFDRNYKPEDIAVLLNIKKSMIEKFYKEYLKEKKEVNKILRGFDENEK